MQDDLEKGGASEQDVMNFFAQALAAVGHSYGADPEDLQTMLKVNAVGLKLAASDPEASTDEIIRRTVKIIGTPMADRYEEIYQPEISGVEDEVLILVMETEPAEA